MDVPSGEQASHEAAMLRRHADRIVHQRSLVAHYRERAVEAQDPRERSHAGRLADDLAAASQDMEQEFRASHPGVDLDALIRSIEEHEPRLKVRRGFTLSVL